MASHQVTLHDWGDVVVMHVRLSTRLRLRTWLGMQMIRLAVWVMGMQVQFEESGDDAHSLEQ